MAVATDELMIWFAVEPEAILSAKFSVADTHAYNTPIKNLSAIRYADFHIIEIWRLRAPQVRILQYRM